MRTVVIVEPHPLFRLGLRQLLTDALPQSTIESHDYHSLEVPPGDMPAECDLLLLSLSKSRCSEELSRTAVKRFQPKRTLLLLETPDMTNPALDFPACVAGAVLREAQPDVLQASVRLVLAGGTCFPASPPRSVATASPESKTLTQTVVDPLRYEPVKWAGNGTAAVAPEPVAAPNALLSAIDALDEAFAAPIKPGSAAHKESQLLGLTPRQYEVLVLLARGYPMKKVGRVLNISVATAKAHTETLYQRLDVHNRNAAVYAAVSRGATLGWANAIAMQPGTPTP